MQITKTRTYRVNLGNYEHIDVSATVTVDDADVVGDSSTMIPLVDKTLALLLEPELDAAALITANENSFVYEAPAPHTAPPSPPTLQRSTLPRKRN